jgi:hypothetical protein
MAFFQQWTLAFGQRAAVLAFNRIARALKLIAAVLFGLVLTQYYDDFSQVEVEELAPSSQEALEGVFELLGWTIAREAHKRLSFQKTFKPLGVVVDFSHSAKRIVVVSNKRDRMEEIAKEADAVLIAGGVTASGAASTRGRILFTDQQCFGRAGAMATRAMSKRANGAAGFAKLDSELKRAYQWVNQNLVTSPPGLLRSGRRRLQ